MEQWQLVGLITRRSEVRILLPLPKSPPEARLKPGLRLERLPDRHSERSEESGWLRPFASLRVTPHRRSVPWWPERGGPTRSHPEHGSETSQRRRYCLGNWVWKIGRCQGTLTRPPPNGRGFFVCWRRAPGRRWAPYVSTPAPAMAAEVGWGSGRCCRRGRRRTGGP
jgi:hypothetical protein